MVDFVFVLAVAVAIEVATVFGKFFFEINSVSFHSKALRRLNLKYLVHIHHMFFGLIICILFSMYWSSLFIFHVGLGIILSDFIHHFVVLWLVMGSPEFYVIHKNENYMSKKC